MDPWAGPQEPIESVPVVIRGLTTGCRQVRCRIQHISRIVRIRICLMYHVSDTAFFVFPEACIFMGSVIRYRLPLLASGRLKQRPTRRRRIHRRLILTSLSMSAAVTLTHIAPYRQACMHTYRMYIYIPEIIINVLCVRRYVWARILYICTRAYTYRDAT